LLETFHVILLVDGQTVKQTAEDIYIMQTPGWVIHLPLH